ncbi:MAG: CPXCG motif-containing cysteine-rich protein [Gammaproteobacteria bacterium]|nr:MAG: CPXCG motif-containing cysteine-rich protein [Gammaproteobacteria bacterium]
MNALEECAADCPYCGEPITVLVDGCGDQSYIEDCEVCCQPMIVNVGTDEDGETTISLHREDE